MFTPEQLEQLKKSYAAQATGYKAAAPKAAVKAAPKAAVKAMPKLTPAQADQLNSTRTRALLWSFPKSVVLWAPDDQEYFRGHRGSPVDYRF